MPDNARDGGGVSPRIISVQSMNVQRVPEVHSWPCWPTDVPGLVVTPCVGLADDTYGFAPAAEFTLTHEQSGRAISRYAIGTFGDMRRLALQLAPLTDWTRRPEVTLGAAVAAEVAKFNEAES